MWKPKEAFSVSSFHWNNWDIISVSSLLKTSNSLNSLKENWFAAYSCSCSRVACHRCVDLDVIKGSCWKVHLRWGKSLFVTAASNHVNAAVFFNHRTHKQSHDCGHANIAGANQDGWNAHVTQRCSEDQDKADHHWISVLKMAEGSF